MVASYTAVNTSNRAAIAQFMALGLGFTRPALPLDVLRGSEKEMEDPECEIQARVPMSRTQRNVSAWPER